MRLGTSTCRLKSCRQQPLNSEGRPKGENGSTKSWQREILLLRTLSALDELEDEDLRQEALQAIALLVINRAIPRSVC